MVEKTPQLNSPLSIIAMFGVIAELAMTVTVFQLQGQERTLFVYFIIGFPVLLLFVFLLLLLLKPHALYGPSDFRSDDAFLKALSGTSVVFSRQQAVVPITESRLVGSAHAASGLDAVGAMMERVEILLNSHLTGQGFKKSSVEFHGRCFHVRFRALAEYISEPFDPVQRTGKHVLDRSYIIERLKGEKYAFVVVSLERAANDLRTIAEIIADDIWKSFEQVVVPTRKK